MSHLLLVTGGCRSGKSAYAQSRAMSIPGRRAYVATCPVIDEEMARRVDAHRRAREGQDWTTLEEPLDLAGLFSRRPAFETILVDCITLWINNLMYQAEQSDRELSEDDLTPLCTAMLDAAAALPAVVIFVANEVGLGIVPDNPQARRFRDLAGRANQLIAARAEEVVLLCSGIPLTLKTAKA
jgi:adenosylcobinamide kinase/adenosylcobinamide-phosphate guanylyltransferase